MLTEPESESAGLAGVGTLETSTREMLLIETWLNANERESPKPLDVLAIAAPSVVTPTMLEAKPRIEILATVVASSSLYSGITPGMNFRNSPMLPSFMSPRESVESTFFRLGA